jgi:hypothetical protein
MNLSGKQAMVDIETLDTVPGGVILSIGACIFDSTGVDRDDTFSMIVNRYSCTDHGLTVSADTLMWWQTQPEEARKVLVEAERGGSPLPFVLGCFRGWLSKHGNPPVWANGPEFDTAFINVATRRIGFNDALFPYRNSRCFRTLKALFGDMGGAPATQGVQHDALDDALWQAEYAVSIFQNLLASEAA